ncbi:hypothetical protein HAZT_HAZT002329 [Hyalella azteca]|uniref:Uncharacterized protein n=1 Tax=Hyalella azteca TaxID=294128 RepID=A0A6A0HDE9_HYAAZ|nr:hypothetical protein HAZT_HAZT002329 [Hyalella azteca]
MNLNNCSRVFALAVSPACRTALPFSAALQSMSGFTNSALGAQLLRHFSSLRFNRNLEFFTPAVKPIVTPDVKGSFRESSHGRPLTVLLSWLMSRDSHMKKFVKFYTDLGFDVLKIRISPFDLIRPVKGTQIVVDQMLQFLESNPSSSPVLVHGFSVGAYIFGEGMLKMANDVQRYGPLMDRFVGQIWDSPVDVEGIPSGVAKAITANKLLQSSIQSYLEWFLRTQYDNATIHYIRSAQKFHECYVRRPALFLLSKADPVATIEMNAVVYEKWEKYNVPVFVKIFEKSPHVSHYYRYKEAYVEEVLTFLQKLGLTEEGKKRQVA